MKKLIFISVAIYFLLWTLSCDNQSESDESSSITQHGITWNLDNEYQYGQFANGDYWVKGPVTITSITPDFDGEHHGWEVNPSNIINNGFDIRIPNFDASLVPSLPYAAGVGESIVKTISYDTSDNDCRIGSNGARGCPQVAAVLTILEEVPENKGASSFRPPYFGNEKTIYSINNLNTSLLGQLESPTSTESLSWFEDRFEKLQLDHLYDWGVRFLHPKDAMPDYGADIVRDTGDMALRFMLNDTVKEKKQALTNYIQYGIDIYGILSNGGSWPSNGGHGHGRKLPVAFAALMLDDSTMIQAISSASHGTFQEDGHMYFSSKADNDGKVLFGQEANEDQYWHTVATKGGLKTARDPYGYIDGGHTPGDSYQLCCNSKPWKGTALALILLPELQTIWNNENFIKYSDRWVSFGGWTQDDPCAPITSRDSTTDWLTVRQDYQILYGPDPANPGDCIRDDDASDGIGRFPAKHHTNADSGQYGSAFANEMWSLYRN